MFCTPAKIVHIFLTFFLYVTGLSRYHKIHPDALGIFALVAAVILFFFRHWLFFCYFPIRRTVEFRFGLVRCPSSLALFIKFYDDKHFQVNIQIMLKWTFLAYGFSTRKCLCQSWQTTEFEQFLLFVVSKASVFCSVCFFFVYCFSYQLFHFYCVQLEDVPLFIFLVVDCLE